MLAESYTINGTCFSSKLSVKEEAKRIRDTQPLGIPLSQKDRDFILEVFAQFYPNWAEKASSPIDEIRVLLITKSRCFQMQLANGETLEPSLRKAFQAPESRVYDLAYNAFRREAWYDCCVKYRDKYFGEKGTGGKAPCELTGERVSREESKVSYVAPLTFKVILDDFLRIEGLSLEQVEVEKLSWAGVYQLLDRALSERWKAYHRSKAQLQVVSRKLDVSLTRDG